MLLAAGKGQPSFGASQRIAIVAARRLSPSSSYAVERAGSTRSLRRVATRASNAPPWSRTACVVRLKPAGRGEVGRDAENVEGLGWFSHPELVGTDTLPPPGRSAAASGRPAPSVRPACRGPQTGASTTASWPVGILGLIVHATC